MRVFSTISTPSSAKYHRAWMPSRRFASATRWRRSSSSPSHHRFPDDPLALGISRRGVAHVRVDVGAIGYRGMGGTERGRGIVLEAELQAFCGLRAAQPGDQRESKIDAGGYARAGDAIAVLDD